MTTTIMNGTAGMSDQNWSIIDRICAFLDGERIDEIEEAPATPSVNIEQLTEEILDLLDESISNDFENFDEDELIKLCELLGINDIEKDFVKFDSDDWYPFAAGVHYFYYESDSQYKGDIKSVIEHMIYKIQSCSYTFYADVDNHEDLGRAVYEEVTQGKGLPYQYAILEDFIDFKGLGRSTYECCEFSKEGKPSYDYYGFFAPTTP